MSGTRLSTGLAVALLVFGTSAEAAAQTPPASTAQPNGQSWPQSPAKEADPPVIPPPMTGAPLSTSGTDVQPVNLLPPAPLVIGSPAASGADAARIRELEARVALDEARLRTLETDVGPLRHLRFMGYVQLQYLLTSNNAAASPNLQPNGSLPAGISSNDTIARADGTTTNGNAFRLRRTRLGATYETDVIRVFLQVDLLPSGGPASTQATIARNAEATGIAHWNKDIRTEFTGGLFQVPFRMELEELSLFRPFIERTWASLNLFPTERDIGVHAKTFALDDHLVVDVGILNGHRLGEPTFTVQPDLNASKDFFATVSGKKLGPIDASLSGYYGRGQIVDAQQLRVKNYDRYAMNVGAKFAKTLVPVLGETRLLGELMFGKNMDTGVVYPFAVPVIPVAFGDDVAGLGERALYLRAEQDLTRWGITGFRFDTYTADVSQSNNARDTYTFMLGARFSKNLRLINELAYAIDNMHLKGTDAPSKHVLQYSAWLQGSFY
ncbi:MAG: hypothetical protein QOI41_5933 [Myxococcales bacterium]|nr:hypothetical protein [Myxococcales bacterium]